MALREKLTERVRPYLRLDDQVQHVFPAQAGLSPWMYGLGGAFVALLAKPRIVVVTDQRIVLLRAGKLTGTQPKGVEAEAPRDGLGPMQGRLWGKLEAAGEKVWVHSRFHKDVEAASSA